MKKVSIIIPTYNQACFIADAVSSALNQNYSNLEVIVMDDSSTDNTFEVIEPYLKDIRLKYIKNTFNIGRVKNYHSGLFYKATGDYVLNLDGDDFLTDCDYIKHAVDQLNNNPEISFCIARILSCPNGGCFDGLLEPDVKYNFNTIDGYTFVNNFFQSKQFFNHLTCLYRRSLAIKLNFYSVDSLWTDGISLLHLACGTKVAVSHKIVGVWRLHNENESTKFYSKSSFSDIFEVVDLIEKSCSGISTYSANYLRYINTYDYLVYLIKHGLFYKFKNFLNFVYKNYPQVLTKHGYKIFYRLSLNSFRYIFRILVNKLHI
jgi:glycosyltransferase involved in cell wall biosynthesis